MNISITYIAENHADIELIPDELRSRCGDWGSWRMVCEASEQYTMASAVWNVGDTIPLDLGDDSSRIAATLNTQIDHALSELRSWREPDLITATHDSGAYHYSLTRSLSKGASDERKAHAAEVRREVRALAALGKGMGEALLSAEHDTRLD